MMCNAPRCITGIWEFDNVTVYLLRGLQVLFDGAGSGCQNGSAVCMRSVNIGMRY